VLNLEALKASLNCRVLKKVFSIEGKFRSVISDSPAMFSSVAITHIKLFVHEAGATGPVHASHRCACSFTEAQVATNSWYRAL
jgi:hypothetical protein